MAVVGEKNSTNEKRSRALYGFQTMRCGTTFFIRPPSSPGVLTQARQKKQVFEEHELVFRAVEQVTMGLPCMHLPSGASDQGGKGGRG